MRLAIDEIRSRHMYSALPESSDIPIANKAFKERQYEDDGIDFKLATTQLHRLARQWLTLGQDSKDFQAQMNFLRESYVIYMNNLGLQSVPWGVDKTVDMSESFATLISQCDTCIRWTNVYHGRTNLRIDLVSYWARMYDRLRVLTLNNSFSTW